jgi:hypothetical protein
MKYQSTEQFRCLRKFVATGPSFHSRTAHTTKVFEQAWLADSPIQKPFGEA